jgi:hypothetical protein
MNHNHPWICCKAATPCTCDCLATVNCVITQQVQSHRVAGSHSKTILPTDPFGVNNGCYHLLGTGGNASRVSIKPVLLVIAEPDFLYCPAYPHTLLCYDSFEGIDKASVVRGQLRSG